MLVVVGSVGSASSRLVSRYSHIFYQSSKENISFGHF